MTIHLTNGYPCGQNMKKLNVKNYFINDFYQTISAFLNSSQALSNSSRVATVVL